MITARDLLQNQLRFGAIPWERILPFVQRFNRARTPAEKERILAELEQFIVEWRRAEEERRKKEKEEEEKRTKKPKKVGG
jgi:hypothetical protein